MRFFPLIDFHDWVLALFLGITATILVCMAFGTHRHRREETEDGEEKRLAARETSLIQKIEQNPHVMFLFVLYAGAAITMIAYFIIVGVYGGPIH